jgi:hypothetical protein
MTAHNLGHHHSAQDCDKDGCSCCGFQFVATAYETISDCRESSAALPPLAELLKTDFPSDFYHPPRA